MSRIRESTRAGDRHAVESGLRHRIGYRLAAGYLSVLLLLGAAWAVAASGANALHVRFSHTVPEGKRLLDRFRAASGRVMRQLDTDRRAGFRPSQGPVALM